MKTLSLAEGASKVHSVERLHTAENRALSQDGPISSRCVHTDEREQGIWSSKKFMENMKFAREEAIRRLQKVPYSKDTIDGDAPPPTCDWVFQEHYEEKFRKFLQVDDDRHRREHNFLIKPSDPIWNKLCTMYNLQEDIVKGASHIFRYTKEYSTLTHYSFASYRPDDNWRGGSLQRFEIQPIIDITRLPEFHYLAYEEAVRVVDQ